MDLLSADNANSPSIIAGEDHSISGSIRHLSTKAIPLFPREHFINYLQGKTTHGCGSTRTFSSPEASTLPELSYDNPRWAALRKWSLRSQKVGALGFLSFGPEQWVVGFGTLWTRTCPRNPLRWKHWRSQNTSYPKMAKISTTKPLKHKRGSTRREWPNSNVKTSLLVILSLVFKTRFRFTISSFSRRRRNPTLGTFSEQWRGVLDPVANLASVLLNDVLVTTTHSEELFPEGVKIVNQGEGQQKPVFETLYNIPNLDSIPPTTKIKFDKEELDSVTQPIETRDEFTNVPSLLTPDPTPDSTEVLLPESPILESSTSKSPILEASRSHDISSN